MLAPTEQINQGSSYYHVFFFFSSVLCRTYGLDSDSALNLYITTLLLHEKADNKHCEDDLGLAKGDERADEGQEDVLGCVLRIVPQLSSTADLVVSLHTAFTKVSLGHNMQVTG